MFGLMLPLTLIIVLALMSGYFSLMESALTESRHGRLEKLADEGREDAKIALEILEDSAKSLTTAKIGITLTGILSGFCAVLVSFQIFRQINFLEHAEIFSVVLALIFVAFVMILLGGVLPVRAAQNEPEKFLLSRHKSFRFIVKLMSPIVTIFSGIAGGAMMLFGMNTETSDAVTEDEVKDLIEQGTEDGTFEESEREMVDKIFHMSDQTAYALMTPRVHMVWLDILDGAEHNLKIVRDNDQNIFPVGEGSLDKCRGVIYAKDLLNAALDKNFHGENFELSKLIKKAMFVPRTMEIFRLMEKFKSSGDSVAIVNDEYGGVVGFITPDDIAQEIVGIKDIESPEDLQFIKKKENSWLVDGLCDIDDFKRRFNFETLPDEERDHFKTMGGFVTSRFGYIPKVGESNEWNGLRFEVVEMDRARVAQILITKIN